MEHFQCCLLVKLVCLKAETIVPAFANLLGSAVVIVGFTNLSLVAVDLGPLLVLHLNSTKHESVLVLLANLSLNVRYSLPSEVSISLRIIKSLLLTLIVDFG